MNTTMRPIQPPTLPPYTGTPTAGEPADDLYTEVSTRLRSVCAAMSPEDFDRLVRDICAMKRRWAPDRGPQRY